MIPKMKRERLCCGLDIGVQTIKASLVRAQDTENLELLGIQEVKTAGLKESAVSDLNEFSESIQKVVANLSQKTGHKIKTIHIGMGGDLVRVRESSAIIPLLDHGNKVITQQDVKKVCHQARLLGIQLEEEILHDFPRYYKVDDVNTAVNPVGLYGRKLGGQFLLLLTNLTRMQNIAKAVNQAGFELGEMSFSSYAASLVALDKKAKNDGVALIDIGATSTAVLIFKDTLLQSVQLVGWGGSHVTQSIASQLNLAIDLAEEIKKSHAVAHKNETGTDEEILVKREQGYMPIKRAGISQAIGPQIDKFIEYIQTSVKDSPFYHHLNAGLVMVGGGSLLPGLIERVEETTNLKVTTGMLTKGLNNSSLYAGVIGLAQMNCTQALNLSMAAKTPRHWTASIRNSFKELYQEYF